MRLPVMTNHQFQKFLHTPMVILTACIGLLFFGQNLLAATNLGPAALVNPFIGTADGGNTYPGAVVPFGMASINPIASKLMIGGYGYNRKRYRGFAMNMMSGTGALNYGDVLFTATTGPVRVQQKQCRFTFSHQDERAIPGYYRVLMKPWGIKAQLTATTRCGMVKFTFPAGLRRNILLPIGLANTPVAASKVQIVGDRTLTGFVSSQAFCGIKRNVAVYFAMQFSRPFETHGTWKNHTVMHGDSSVTQGPKHGNIGAYVSWPAISRQTAIRVRVGISYVSINGAIRNLKAEMPSWKFFTYRAAALRKWNKALSVIQVRGGSAAHRTIFYTALYHALLMPNVFDDVDGRYVGFDGKIHHVPTSHKHIYANFSGWDIYRSEIPLLTILEPQRVADMAQSLVEMYKQQGYMDRWPEANVSTGVMNGNPLTIALVSIWNAGVHNFNVKTAWKAMLRQTVVRNSADWCVGQGQGPLWPHTYSPNGVSRWHNQAPGPYQGVWREKHGAAIAANTNVATAEEYDIAFAALAQFAKEFHKTGLAAYLTQRALGYRTLYNPATGFMQGKTAMGAWRKMTRKRRDQYDFSFYCEGSAWEYLWLAPQDVRGLIELLGGDRRFTVRLQHFFNAGHYDPTNEPDLEAPWEFDYARYPWLTQKYVAQVADKAFTDAPGGLAGGGNDDCGEMSAWYVLTQLGIYPEFPGRPEFVISTPRFKHIVIRLRAPYKGRQFIINAPGAGGKNMYIQSSTLNGQTLNRPWLSESVITNGGVWDMRVGPHPNKAWGSAGDARPWSMSTGAAAHVRK